MNSDVILGDVIENGMLLQSGMLGEVYSYARGQEMEEYILVINAGEECEAT